MSLNKEVNIGDIKMTEQNIVTFDLKPVLTSHQ